MYTKSYYSPNDEGVTGYDDSLSIQNAIDLAKFHKVDKVVIPRYNRRTNSNVWTITRAILLPSNITVILDNCHLVMADGVICNLFRNSAIRTEKIGDADLEENILLVESERQNNIVIQGEGYAVLDGGKSNNVLESNWEKENKPTPKNNNLILFSGVDDFLISDITVTNQRWWAINVEYCTHGRITDIYVYALNSVPNQDGVHLKEGCNNITVQRIFGQSGDDFVALTALTIVEFILAEEIEIDRDIHDVKILDLIGTSVRQAVIAMRCQDEHKMYNVEIENVIQSDGGDKNNYPYSANIRIGTNGYFKYREAPFGNRYNLTIKNLITPVHTAIVFCEQMENCEFENIRQVSGWTPLYIDGVKMRNVKIKGLFVSNDITASPIFTENGQREDDFIDNLNITDFYYKGEKEICNLKIDSKTNIIVDGKKL